MIYYEKDKVIIVLLSIIVCGNKETQAQKSDLSAIDTTSYDSMLSEEKKELKHISQNGDLEAVQPP